MYSRSSLRYYLQSPFSALCASDSSDACIQIVENFSADDDLKIDQTNMLSNLEI